MFPLYIVNDPAQMALYKTAYGKRGGEKMHRPYFRNVSGHGVIPSHIFKWWSMLHMQMCSALLAQGRRAAYA